MGIVRFDRFTDEARMVLVLAREEATRLRHTSIGSEHLLLGILRVPESAATGLLEPLDVDIAKLCGAVEAVAGSAQERGVREVGLTAAARRAIRLAVEEARRRKGHTIDAADLLLGVLREGQSMGVSVLTRFGVTLDQARGLAIVRKQAPDQQAPPAGASGPKSNVVTCRLDDRALEALDALVEAGIRPTRSDAAAWLINTGIEAHQALFDRVHATVDEIRKLRLEAQTLLQPEAMCASGSGLEMLTHLRAAKPAPGRPERPADRAADRPDTSSETPGGEPSPAAERGE